MRVRAFGVNRMDIAQRRGDYPPPPQAPSTLGVEFSGVVEALGPGRHPGWAVVGAPVLGLAYGGAYAECVAVASRILVPKPDALSWVQAAAVPEAWITAAQALHRVLALEPDRSVLWHAGASGVSMAGIQLSRLAGASHVLATAGSDDKCAALTGRLGATAAFNYRTDDWPAAVRRATAGRGVDYIVDPVGAAHFQKNLDAAAPDCRIVLLGTLSGGRLPAGADLSPLLFKRIRLEGSTLRSRDEDYQAALRDRLESYMADFVAGRLCIVVDTVLPWHRVHDAHALMEESKNAGKIVCTIP